MKPARMMFAVLVSACGGPSPMRRALRIAAVVILAACGGDGATDVGTTGRIGGTFSYHTGAIVANAAVALTGNAQADRTTNTATNGVYTFADVPDPS